MNLVEADQIASLPGLSVGAWALDRVSIRLSIEMLNRLRKEEAQVHIGARPWSGPESSFECGEFLGKTRIDFLEPDGHVRIGRCGTLNTTIACYRGVEVSIGDRTTINGARFSVMNSRVVLGEDCMLGDSIIFQPNDQHAIYDLENLDRVNTKTDIILGDRVWVGLGAFLLAGAEIGEGSIIGAGSIVTGSIPPFSVAAGVPARVVRSNVSWSRNPSAPDSGTHRMRERFKTLQSKTKD
ncbi:acyltransferase [Hyphomicrobium sp.]|uniref:acyltransferase n=1 Tax=Hyphomicrobium sp. TaxID=82 RepID=UPI000FAD5CB5|nr:acyltransferase [Hyphomicrobium sp.]RUP08789.1 MAG: acyltransferase [Hyphomicrobium sp.]